MRRRGFDDYQRQRIIRKQQNTILVLCCGKTEINYFQKYNLDLGKIKVLPILEDCSPKSIVTTAISKKAEGYRQIWCVFDKDDYEDFDEAITLANNNAVRVAYSNQAFDLWFIKHFRQLNGSFSRNKYEEEINSYLIRPDGKKYTKPYKELYDKLKPKISDAIHNAKTGHQVHTKNGGVPSDWESCTTVYKIVEELLRWMK